MAAAALSCAPADWPNASPVINAIETAEIKPGTAGRNVNRGTAAAVRVSYTTIGESTGRSLCAIHIWKRRLFATTCRDARDSQAVSNKSERGSSLHAEFVFARRGSVPVGDSYNWPRVSTTVAFADFPGSTTTRLTLSRGRVWIALGPARPRFRLAEPNTPAPSASLSAALIVP